MYTCNVTQILPECFRDVVKLDSSLTAVIKKKKKSESEIHEDEDLTWPPTQYREKAIVINLCFVEVLMPFYH